MNGNFDNQNMNRYNSDNTLKKNSRRTLYLAVFVAALFVVAISGTFAYFQASITSNGSGNNAINGNIYDPGTYLNSIVITKLNGTATNGDKLIPFDTDNNYDATNGALNGNTQGAAMVNVALQNNCIDSNGYTACHVFQINVRAGANSPRIPISGTITISGNKVSNLNFTIIKPRSTTAATGISQLSMTDTYYNGKVAYNTSAATLNFTDITGATDDNYLPANATSNIANNYYYLIVWLEDTGSDQTSANANGNYTGTVTVAASSGGNSKITATFSSGA